MLTLWVLASGVILPQGVANALDALPRELGSPSLSTTAGGATPPAGSAAADGSTSPSSGNVLTNPSTDGGAFQDVGRPGLTTSPWFWVAAIATPAGLGLMVAAAALARRSRFERTPQAWPRTARLVALAEPDSEPQPEPGAEGEPASEAEARTGPDTRPEAEAEPEPEFEAEPGPDVEPEPEPEFEAEPGPDVEPEPEPDAETELQPVPALVLTAAQPTVVLRPPVPVAEPEPVSVGGGRGGDVSPLPPPSSTSGAEHHPAPNVAPPRRWPARRIASVTVLIASDVLLGRRSGRP